MPQSRKRNRKQAECPIIQKDDQGKESSTEEGRDSGDAILVPNRRRPAPPDSLSSLQATDGNFSTNPSHNIAESQNNSTESATAVNNNTSAAATAPAIAARFVIRATLSLNAEGEVVPSVSVQRLTSTEDAPTQDMLPMFLGGMGGSANHVSSTNDNMERAGHEGDEGHHPSEEGPIASPPNISNFIQTLLGGQNVNPHNPNEDERPEEGEVETQRQQESHQNHPVEPNDDPQLFEGISPEAQQQLTGLMSGLQQLHSYLQLLGMLRALTGDEEPHGISAEQLQERTTVFRRSTLAQRGTLCAICQEPHNGRQAVRQINACGHHFHRKCIDRWLQQSTKCPLCNGGVETLKIEPDGGDSSSAGGGGVSSSDPSPTSLQPTISALHNEPGQEGTEQGNSLFPQSTMEGHTE